MESSGSGGKRALTADRSEMSNNLRKDHIEQMVLKRRALFLSESHNKEDEDNKFEKFALSAGFLASYQMESEMEDSSLLTYQDQVESMSLILEQYPNQRFARVLFESKVQHNLVLYLQVMVQKSQNVELVRGAKHALNLIAVLIESSLF